jgi:hypothetical protein
MLKTLTVFPTDQNEYPIASSNFDEWFEIFCLNLMRGYSSAVQQQFFSTKLLLVFILIKKYPLDLRSVIRIISIIRYLSTG